MQMKKLLWLLIFPLFLSGCSGEEQEGEDKNSGKQLMSELLGTISEVDSYEMDVEITSSYADGKRESTSGKVTVADFDMPEMHAVYERMPEVVSRENTPALEYYQAGERLVINLGDGWTNRSTEDITADDLPSVRYMDIVQLLREVEGELDTDQSGNRIIYKGDSQKVFGAFKKTLSTSFRSIQPETAASQLEVRLDDQSSIMKDFHYTVTGTEKDQTETISYRLQYHRMNEVEGIDIPDEVLDEMSGTTTH
jgi:outer membrane lipoprotein-sorting protein